MTRRYTDTGELIKRQCWYVEKSCLDDNNIPLFYDVKRFSSYETADDYFHSVTCDEDEIIYFSYSDDQTVEEIATKRLTKIGDKS